MKKQRRAKHYLIDMDGVIYRGTNMIPGADLFVERLEKLGRKFLFLTNSSDSTPVDLQGRLSAMGIQVDVECFYTSALATAAFLHAQKPEGKAFIIGERGLKEALFEVGYTITEKDPDYVILGETKNYDFYQIATAIRLIDGGVPFIATNPDVTGPFDGGIIPACGSFAALIEKATGRIPYFIGKPNPLIMRKALRTLDVHSTETAIIGDRMDTDIVAGIESGLETILVLSGVTGQEDLLKYSYRPDFIFNSIADIEP
jgi:NagD protein